MAAVIAIVAIVGGLCTFLFKVSISILNAWPQKGVMHWYLIILFLSALSIGVIIFFDIFIYVLNDLKRYNVSDAKYSEYDTISDKSYLCLVKDFKIYVIMLFGLFLLIIPLNALYEKTILKCIIVSLCVLMTIVGIFLLIYWIKSYSKEKIKKYVKDIIICIMKKLGVLIVCGVLCVAYISNSSANLSVNYRSDGCIEVNSSSSENYKEVDIEIYNEENQIIYNMAVEEEELLHAREEKYIINEQGGEIIGQAIMLNDERLHWTYQVELNKKITKPGRYSIMINVHQDGKIVEFINEFNLEQDKYIFAKDSMKKEY